MKMNNKGQSLILFVLLVPVLLLILVSVYEIGKLVLLRNEIDDICKMATSYGLDNLDSESLISDVNKLVLKNKDDLDSVDIQFIDDKLYVKLEDKIQDDLLIIGNFNNYNLKCSYVGYLDEDKKVIRKDN